MMNRRIKKKKGLLKDSQYEHAKENWLRALKEETDKFGDEAVDADWAKMREKQAAVFNPPD